MFLHQTQLRIVGRIVSRFILGKTVPSVLITARDRRPLAQFFPIRTSRLVNNICTQTALRTNQIVEFVTVPSEKKMSKNIMNRNHVCYSLNDKIHVFCCFRYSYNPLFCFSLNSYCWYLSSSCASFFMVYFCLLVDVVFFPLSGFFFSYIFLFFFLILLHSLSFFNKLFSICSWFSTTFFTILSSIYLFLCCHRSTRT